MKTPKIFAPILLCLSLVMGCDKQENNEATGNYPLQIANSWQYFTETQAGTNYSSFTSQWQVLADTTINGISAHKISQLNTSSSGNTHQAYSYYANQSDGLHGIAVENSGSGFFFKDGGSEYQGWNLMNTFPYNARKKEDIFVPDTALYILRYPIVTNDIWRSNEYGPGANVKRKWIGTETITVPAGTFNCNKLQVMFDFNDDFVQDSGELMVFQHYSDKGLIQEEQFRTPGASIGDTMGFYRITKLTQVNF